MKGRIYNPKYDYSYIILMIHQKLDIINKPSNKRNMNMI